MPGPASIVGDRPPMNPAIWVCFSSEVDGFFFRGGNKNARNRLIRNTLFNEKRTMPSTGKIEKQSLHTLSLSV